MSTQRNIKHHYSLAEYFDLERTSGLKHEYFDGTIYAMVGASLRHVLITTNFNRALGNALDNTPCRVLGNDMRVLTGNGLFTYPDLSVVCGEIELTDDEMDTLANPMVLIEVLSKSTAPYDRGDKFEMYKTIPTLREYLLVAQDEISIEATFRRGGGKWRAVPTLRSIEDELSLESISVRVPVAEIYRDVDF